MDPTQWEAPFPVVFLVLFVIVMLRANGTYWLGRFGAAGAHRTGLARLMDSPGYARATQRVNTYGAPVVALSFLTIGVQTLVNLAAGASGMPLPRYLPAVAVGSVLWAALYATIGTAGAEALGRLYSVSPAAALAVGMTLVIGVVGYIVVQYRRRTRA